jgi:3-(3-hydroxy-phenyl)propionate hydroxylase
VRYEKTKALNPSAGSGYELPSYAFEMPPELINPEQASQLIHPVVIVGAGLAGLTAACDFALRGIPAIVIDEDDTVGVKGASSRGICYAQKSLEVFRRLGIYDRIKAKGVEWSVGKTLAGNDIVYEFDLAKQASHNVSEQPPFINLQQFYLEWFLADRIEELGVSKVRWQSRVKNVEQFKDHVLLDIETPKGSYQCKARWLIDASGLRSPIREASGLKVEQSLGVDRWCISDVRFKDKKPVERWTWIEAPFNDNKAVWQHLMADDVWRLDYQMQPDADPEYVSSPEVVAERLKRHLGDDVEFELIWVGPYAYRSHLLEKFRQKRIFFVGDCAHVMSPFGARGGNSAIQDSDNLVWKLASVLQGKAQEDILDSYSDERREGAKTNIQITNRTARFLSPKTPVEKMTRNAVIELAKKFPFARALVNTGRLSTANTYREKPLCIAGKASVPMQNCAVQAPSEFTDLMSVVETHQYRPLLIAFSLEAQNAALKRGFNESYLVQEYSIQPILLLSEGGGEVKVLQQSGDIGWPKVVLSETNYARLTEDFGVSGATGFAEQFALLRPDLYGAGLVGLKSINEQLSSLGLKTVLSQKVAA